MNDKIRELERQLEIEKQKINNCQHDWGDVYYNPEDYKEEYFTGEYESHGVHHYPIMGYKDAKKDRWSRKCIKCGFEQHTYEREAVKVEYKAKFD